MTRVEAVEGGRGQRQGERRVERAVEEVRKQVGEWRGRQQQW